MISGSQVLIKSAGLEASSSPNISEALSQSYAPVYVKCPNNQEWIRPASSGLSPHEAKWVRGRKAVVADALSSYLERLGLADFDVSKYTKSISKNNYAHTPTIGMAISGGGWASAFTGTGAIRALDDRLEAAVQARTGGLLQSLTYLSGLSGGSWPVLSFAAYDFPTADEIVVQWQVGINPLDVLNDTDGYLIPETIFEDVGAKAKAGFPVSFSDYLGIGYGTEFFPGLDTLVSDIVSLDKYKKHQMPFPIVQFNEIDDDDTEYFGVSVPHTNATIVSHLLT